MEISAQDRNTLRRYLLGQMVEADLSRVEERLMTDSDSYQELLILEDEVVDQYVRDQMSSEDREGFEKYFMLSPEHRQKVRFARALSKYVNLSAAAQPASSLANEYPLPRAVNGVTTLQSGLDEATREIVQSSERPGAAKKDRFWSFWPIQNPILNYGLAVTVIVVVAGISWTVLRSLRTPTGPGKIFAVTLSPGGLTRDGGEMQTFPIPPGTDTVQLQLLLPPDQYQDYGVEILASDGRSVWTREDLKPEEKSGRKSLQVNVPAQVLRRDTYRLKLRAHSADSYEEVASYTFRVND